MAEAKVGIGSVWETAVEAVRGRAGILVPLAALTLLLPSVVQAGVALYATGGAAGLPPRPGLVGALLRAALALGVLVLTLWGALAITAVTGDPAVTAAEARRRASERLLPLLGVTVTLSVALTLLVLPLVGVLAASGVDMAAMGRGAATPPTLGAGTSLFVGLYGFAAGLFVLWLFARLLPLVAIVLDERLGLRAVPRSLRLTRGMTLRLIGALLLYGIVLFVASSAAEWIAFIPFRLLLGPENIGAASLIGKIVGAAVAAVFSVLAYAFTAQLYRRLAERAPVPPLGEAHPAV